MQNTTIFVESKSTNVLWKDIFDRDDVNYYNLSSNPQIDAVTIERHIDAPWDWSVISRRASKNVILKYSHWPFDMKALSCNHRIDIDCIEQTKDILTGWYASYLAAFLDIGDDRFNDICMTQWEDETLGWHMLSSNNTLTWEFVKEHSTKEWDWVALSRLLLTPALLEEYPTYPWKDIGIVQNVNFSLDECLKRANKCKGLHFWLSKHPNLNAEFMELHSSRPWNWYEFSNSQPDIDLNYVVQNLNRPWNWDVLTRHFHWNDIQNNNLPWSIRGLYQNIHLRFEDLRSIENVSHWSWGVIVWDFEIASRKWMAAYKIQTKLWKRVAFDPTFRFCQKRLLMIYTELVLYSL